MINPNALPCNGSHAGADDDQTPDGDDVTWFRVDDGFNEHPKVLALGRVRLPAVGLWTQCGIWCARNLTDGYVPMRVVREHDPKLRYAPRLVEVGLWVPVAPADVPAPYLQLEASWKRIGNGLSANWYFFHDWSDQQPLRAQVQDRRRKTAARVSKWREKNADHSTVEAPRNAVTGITSARSRNAVTSTGGNAVTPLPRNAVGNAAPDPTRISTTSSTSYEEVVLTNPPALRAVPPTRPRRATRIPDDFTATEAMIAWARENTPDVGRAETENFRDYWVAATRNAEKRDWVAAWRFWMRREQKRHDERRPANGRPAHTSARMDKVLAALHPDDPFLREYGQPTSPLIIEGGTS